MMAKKNIVSTNDNSLLKLGHLNPELFYIENEKKLEQAVKQVSKRKNGQLCFAIDTRNRNPINFLKKQGIYTETKCMVFSFSLFLNPLNSVDTISISTGEI